MASLLLDAESLSALLTAAGPPAFTTASCSIDEHQLLVRIKGLTTGMTLFGRDLGRIDAEFRITGKRIDDQRLAFDWEPGAIGGIPAGMVRFIDIDALVQPLLRRLLAGIGVEAAVVSSGRSIEVDLGRLPDARGVVAMLRCQRFDLPAARGQAVSIGYTLGGTGHHTGHHRKRER